jgi:hypothetical protein
LEISDFRKFLARRSEPETIIMMGQKNLPKSKSVSSSTRKREPAMMRITPQKMFLKFMALIFMDERIT